MREVVSLEQQRFTLCLGQGVRETVSEVQLCRVATSFAKIVISLTRNSHLRFGDGLDDRFRLLDQVIESTARDRIPASIDDDRCFDVIYRRDTSMGGCLNRMRKRGRLRFR